MEEVISLYEAYLEEFYQLERKRKPMEGAFGFGGGPKNYPCHDRFAGDLDGYGNQGKGPVWWYPMDKMFDPGARPPQSELEELKDKLRKELDLLAGQPSSCCKSEK